MFCAIYMPFEVWPNIMRTGTLITTTNSWSKNIHFLHSDLYSLFQSERKISQSTYSSAKLIAPAMYYYCTCYLIFDEGFSANYFVIRVFCLDFISLYGPLKGGTFHTLSTKRRSSSTIQKCTRYFGNIINTIQETQFTQYLRSVYLTQNSVLLLGVYVRSRKAIFQH